MATVIFDGASVLRLGFVRETTEHGDRRAYYTACAPWLAVVVLRNGLDLKTVVHQVVNADISVKPAPAAVARPGNADKPHTIVSVAGLANDMADFALVLVMERLREAGGEMPAA